jgi:hypothetical protein
MIKCGDDRPHGRRFRVDGVSNIRNQSGTLNASGRD